MKIELITPESELLRRLRKWRLIHFPQLTMPLIAALTPEDVEISHTDEAVKPIDYNIDTDLVAITCNTPMANHVYQIANEFRRRGKKVVLGGPHVTVMPQEALAHADAVVLGEAEGVWHEVVGDFRQGSWKKVYQGSPADLCKLPPVRRDLFKGRAYGRGVIIATRGCPNQCEFCSLKSFYGPGQRQRPVDHVVNEIGQIPGKAMIFWDDYLTANRAYAMELFKAIAPYKKWWTSQATIQTAFDEELLDAAAASGCKGLFIGLESVSQDSLNAQGKHFNKVSMYEKAVKNLHKYGITVQAGTMFGFDSDDYRIFERTLKYYQDIGIDSATVSLVTPMPGTELFNRLEREERILTTNWDKYNGKVDAVFKPAQMSPRELEDGVKWFGSQFYSIPSIFKRLFINSRVGLLWNFSHNLGYRLALVWRDG